MAKVLLAGFGKLARALAPVLIEQGHHVIGLARSNITVSGVASIQWDLAEPPQSFLDSDRVTELSHLDYVVVTLSPDEISDDAYRRAYVDATSNLLAILQAQELSPKIIYVSSTRVYAHNDGEWVDESSPTLPTTCKGQSLLEAEQLIRQQSSDNIVVRFSGIYGSERNYFKKRVEAGIKIQKRPAQFSNRIHQEDCIGVLNFLIAQFEKGARLDPLLLASDDDPAPLLEVANHISQNFNYPKPTIIINDGDLAPVGKRCRNDKLKSLGYRFRYPSFRDGYQA